MSGLLTYLVKQFEMPLEECSGLKSVLPKFICCSPNALKYGGILRSDLGGN